MQVAAAVEVMVAAVVHTLVEVELTAAATAKQVQMVITEVQIVVAAEAVAVLTGRILMVAMVVAVLLFCEQQTPDRQHPLQVHLL